MQLSARCPVINSSSLNVFYKLWHLVVISGPVSVSGVVLQLDVRKPNKSDILGNDHGLNWAWILPWNFTFLFSLKNQKFSEQSITKALGENADILMLEYMSIQREPSVLCCQAANYSQKRLKLSMVFPNDLILYSELKIHYVKCWCDRKDFCQYKATRLSWYSD